MKLTREELAAIFKRRHPVSKEALDWAAAQMPAVEAVRSSGADTSAFPTFASLKEQYYARLLNRKAATKAALLPTEDTNQPESKED